MSKDLTATKISAGNFSLLQSLPLLGLHAACLLVIWTGVSRAAIAVGILSYLVRAFGLTAGYHRYFSHRSFKTSRGFQFALALLGAAAAQMGPLWWAGHHRTHHANTDKEKDVHSPVQRGFWWAHIGWLLCGRYWATDVRRVRDWLKYPELVFLDRYYYLAPLLYAAGMFALGAWLGARFPALGTSALQILVWGFFISTVALYHATFCVNSVSHLIGARRFETNDQSRNNAIVAFFTLGEGWHNNHHHCPNSEKQGIAWWEFDPTHWVLKALSWLGLTWNLKSAAR